MLHFHPQKSDYLIWTGNRDCHAFAESCHVEAAYSRDNGRKWYPIESYVRNCAWARDSELLVDPSQIICESYRDKKGSQRFFQVTNPLELVGGTDFFQKKTKLFDNVVGFAKFSEYLVVAEVREIFLYCLFSSGTKMKADPVRPSIFLNADRWISRYHWMGGLLLPASSRTICVLNSM